MFNLLRFLLITAFLFSSSAADAQLIPDPTTWTYEVKKTGDNKYDLVFKLKLKEHWHIWSLNPGGDGMQIPPEFNFSVNPSFKTVGKVRESGKKITDSMEGVDGKVSYFHDRVD